MPRSGTWFLRYVLAIYDHLLAGRGEPFDFGISPAGPLFWFEGIDPATHFFIGHTVCPGFAGAAGEDPGWNALSFHVAGYDYFHTSGYDYRFVPVFGGANQNLRVDVGRLDQAFGQRKRPRVVFVYRNPLDQAVSMYRYSVHHKSPAFSAPGGRALAGISTRDYLFDICLPSYMKLFLSYQVVNAHAPGDVLLVSYEEMVRDVEPCLTRILGHHGHVVDATRSASLVDALGFSTKEHLQLVEELTGSSLDGSQQKSSLGHIADGTTGKWRDRLSTDDKRQVLDVMKANGIETSFFHFGD